MTYQDKLNQHYEEWKSLSQAENRAIRAHDWSSLSSYHRRKTELQESIRAIEHEWKQSSATPGGKDAQDPNQVDPDSEFGEILAELIGMERENLKLIEDHRKSAQVRQSDLKKSSQNLKRLHQAYVTHRESVWQSYS